MTDTDGWHAAARKSMGPGPILAAGVLAICAHARAAAIVGRASQVIEDDAQEHEEGQPHYRAATRSPRSTDSTSDGRGWSPATSLMWRYGIPPSGVITATAPCWYWSPCVLPWR